MPMQLEPLYVRGKGNTDKLFYFAMIVGTNMALYHVPQPLIPVVGYIYGNLWAEASKN